MATNRDGVALSRRRLLAGFAATGLAASVGDRALGKAEMARTQAPFFHRLSLGVFELTVLSDGPLHFGPPQGGVFSELSAEGMAKILTDNHLPTDDVLLDQNILMVNTGERLVLIDTGLGVIKMLGEDSGRLIANMKAAGADPDDVDAVVITHAHGDHIYGLLRGDAKPTFPNAQIYMSQADYDFWTDHDKLKVPEISQMVAGAQRHLLPLRDRMVFIKDGQEFLPGFHAIATPGHTVGHISVMVTSRGNSICNIADVAHHHIISMETPRRAFGYDTDGAQGVASRVRLFDMLAAQRIPLIAYHFPWPGIGRVGKHGDAYRYFPSPMRAVL